jgi:hypothetical protein
MQVMVRSAYSGRVTETSLEGALTPEGYKGYDSGGATEQAQSDATAACEALGRLTALLVEQKVINLEDALVAMGVSDCVEMIS